MAYGGTNFGLTAGANFKSQFNLFQAHVTTYDYNAVITEQGRVTPKFYAMQKLMTKYVRSPTISIPVSILAIKIPEFTPALKTTLLANLPLPFLRDS